MARGPWKVKHMKCENLTNAEIVQLEHSEAYTCKSCLVNIAASDIHSPVGALSLSAKHTTPGRPTPATQPNTVRPKTQHQNTSTEICQTANSMLPDPPRHSTMQINRGNWANSNNPDWRQRAPANNEPDAWALIDEKDRQLKNRERQIKFKETTIRKLEDKITEMEAQHREKQKLIIDLEQTVNLLTDENQLLLLKQACSEKLQAKAPNQTPENGTYQSSQVPPMPPHAQYPPPPGYPPYNNPYAYSYGPPAPPHPFYHPYHTAYMPPPPPPPPQQAYMPNHEVVESLAKAVLNLSKDRHHQHQYRPNYQQRSRFGRGGTSHSRAAQQGSQYDGRQHDARPSMEVRRGGGGDHHHQSNNTNTKHQTPDEQGNTANVDGTHQTTAIHTVVEQLLPDAPRASEESQPTSPRAAGMHHPSKPVEESAGQASATNNDIVQKEQLPNLPPPMRTSPHQASRQPFLDGTGLSASPR